MASETIARTEQSPPPDEGDYQAFCAAVSASARGRAFLAEYTRRNRNADTEVLFTAIDKLQSVVTANVRPETSDAIKKELLSLLADISAAQAELQANILAIKAAKFADLIAFVERRIADLVAPSHATPMSQADPAPVFPNATADDVGHVHLTIVPLPEQPELPIPSPAAAQPPAIALVRDEVVMAEVSFVEPLPLSAAANSQRIPHTVELPKVDLATGEATGAARALPPADPLASIMALSEEERLALFT